MTGSVSIQTDFMSHENQKMVKFLQAKPRIGSSKNPINYATNQTVFHHDDIPDARRQRAMEVREWAMSHLLSVERRPWTKATKPDAPVCERRQLENSAKDRSRPYAYNYRAETLDFARLVPPIDKPTKFRMSRQTESEVVEITRIMDEDRVQRGILKRTEEMPVNPKLIGATEWNNTMVYPPRAQQASLDRMTAKSRQWTKRVNETLGLTKEYVTPIDQVRQLNETLREQKKNKTFSPKKLVSHQAEATVDKISTKNRQANEPSRKYSIYNHSGTWEFNPMEQRYMWSDTGSFVYDSRGDVKRSFDPDRYNLEGPTQFRPITRA